MRNPEGPATDPEEDDQVDNLNQHNNVSLQDVIESMDSPFRDAYKDPTEIQNYRQDGSYFHGKSMTEIRDMVEKDALKHGLLQSQLADFKNGSTLWKNEKREAEGQKIDTGETVYFKNFKRVHVAQGFTDDTMYITVPLWFDRPIIDKKTGNLLYTKREMGNFAILSSHKIIRPSDSYFRERGIVAEFPETVLDERWSMDSIREFQDPKISVDPITVFNKLNEIWKKYMDLSGNPGAYTALPLINTLGYCLWLFQYAPYLKYEGEKGSSKSKACEIHEYLDFNAFSGVDLTPSVIFRTLQDTRGTLIIDEAETYDKLKNKSEYEQAREAIINAGFKINGKVPRMERIDNRFTRVDFHVFGIKIIGSIHGVSETIRDRSYQIMLIKTLNKEISGKTPRAGDPVFQEARDMLYTMILNHWKEIQKIEQEEEIDNRLGLIGRDWDKAKPLLVLATFYAKHDPEHGREIFNELWAFLNDQRNRLIALTLDTFDEVVINNVEDAINEELESAKLSTPDDQDVEIRLKDVAYKIAEQEEVTEKKDFSLRRYSRSVKNKIVKLDIGRNFKHGGQNITVFVSNLNLIKNARKRYGISPPGEEKQDVINLINPINPINLINLINTFNQQLGLIKVNQKSNPENLINPPLNQENRDSLMKEVNQLIKLITTDGTLPNQMPSKTNEEPATSDIQNEKLTFNMNEVKNYIIEIVRDEAPKSQFHSFSKREIIEFVRDRYPGIAVGPVYDLIHELHAKGFIYQPNGKNFVYNAEGG